MLLATAAGTYEVDGEGAARQIDTAPALAVSAHPKQIYILTEAGAIRWGALPAPGQTALWKESAAAGVVDVQAWCADRVLIARESGLELWSPEQDSRVSFGPPMSGVRGVAMWPEVVCEGALVRTADALKGIEGVKDDEAGTARTLISAIVSPRAVAADMDGELGRPQGRPAVRSIVEAEGLAGRARHLGDARDVSFGPGALFNSDNIYIASGEGRLEYARVRLTP